ncbi:GAF domain-containing protein [Nocardioides bruguierae]|uniref:GAF domain-containing protein n=1 Tax=Nocardioides bruguierae TaxID=2945102 RepID=A0A9X2IFE0_9ACTN|nr:GAF domain-containing protein [Nocardioides bruguierae]MCM0621232.1 GAF domain-containing protein [Nocardioides bruguierae]
MPTRSPASDPRFEAVAPGTDLGVRARELRRIRDAVLGGGRAPSRPRALVARSWRRVLDVGLDPDGDNARDPLGPAAVEEARRASRLSLVVDELRLVLGSVADASHFLVVITDADGVVLWRDGAAGVRRKADDLGFAEGATWTERQVGTNAIGTAIAEAAPVQLFSAEHFEAQQHPWYCTAAPVHDPRDGSLLGVVDVSGPALTLHPAIGGLVASAVRLGEAGLWRRHHEDLERLRRRTEHVVGGSGPLLVVDDEGWVAHRVGVAAGPRLEAPSAGRPLAVPGLGVCLAEPLGDRPGDGWLVRPAATAASARPLRARLLAGPPAVLEVADGGGGAPWRVQLTPRHAEIVRTLAAAGSAGTDAAGLSRALHGDAEHLVTVRAEVSRLRRVLGALVLSGPYRLAPEVVLEIEPRS